MEGKEPDWNKSSDNRINYLPRNEMQANCVGAPRGRGYSPITEENQVVDWERNWYPSDTKQKQTNCIKEVEEIRLEWSPPVKKETQVGCVGASKIRGGGLSPQFTDFVPINYVGALQELCQAKQKPYCTSTGGGIADYMLTNPKETENCIETSDEKKCNLFSFSSDASNHLRYGLHGSNIPLTPSRSQVNPTNSFTAKYQSAFNMVADWFSSSEGNDESFKNLNKKNGKMKVDFTTAFDILETQDEEIDYDESETEKIASVLQKLGIDKDFNPEDDDTKSSAPEMRYSGSQKRLEENSTTNRQAKYNTTRRNYSKSFIEAQSGGSNCNHNLFQTSKNDTGQPTFDHNCFKENLFPEFAMRPSSNKEYFRLLKSLASRMKLEIKFEPVPYLTSNNLAQCLLHIHTDTSVVCYGSAKSENKAKYAAARSAFEYLKSMYGKR